MLSGCGSLSVQPPRLNTSYIYNPSSLAVPFHLQRLYCPGVHLGWTQTAPLGAFIPTTMWLNWHFVCDWPPQPYSAAAIFSGFSLATKTLGRKKRDVKKENKERDWWLFFDLIFCHPTTGMIADCLRLSNCSFCAYLIGDKRLKCPSGMNLQHSCQCTKCFSAYKMADVIIFAMFA